MPAVATVWYHSWYPDAMSDASEEAAGGDAGTRGDAAARIWHPDGGDGQKMISIRVASLVADRDPPPR